MKKISTKKLIELKNRFWKRNKPNELNEFYLPLFFNELKNRKT